MDIKNNWSLKLDELNTDQVIQILDFIVCGGMKTCQKCDEAGLRGLCYKVGIDVATEEEKIKYIKGLVNLSSDKIHYGYLGVDLANVDANLVES